MELQFATHIGTDKMSTWKKIELIDGIWWICNDCDSLDEHGRVRLFKCRTTNPATFNLCDKGA